MYALSFVTVYGFYKCWIVLWRTHEMLRFYSICPAKVRNGWKSLLWGMLNFCSKSHRTAMQISHLCFWADQLANDEVRRGSPVTSLKLLYPHPLLRRHYNWPHSHEQCSHGRWSLCCAHHNIWEGTVWQSNATATRWNGCKVDFSLQRDFL